MLPNVQEQEKAKAKAVETDLERRKVKVAVKEEEGEKETDLEELEARERVKVKDKVLKHATCASGEVISALSVGLTRLGKLKKIQEATLNSLGELDL